MCTSITFQTKDHYFGRNLDLEVSFGQQAVITPRDYSFDFRCGQKLPHHYGIIGVAAVSQGYPLYFDAINEHGLGMAGLNYPNRADYKQPVAGKDNISPFEFIPWLLGQAKNLQEAKQLLARINLVKIDFSDQFKLSPLHWLVADQTGSVVVESDVDGLHVYDNPVGVLTNNPSFPKQLFNLNNYRALSSANPANAFSKDLDLEDYSRGLGTRGLPGGMDSESRFVKVAFTKFNSVAKNDELSSVNQYFHVLQSVEQQNGTDEVAPGKFEYTIYSTCYNQDQGIMYYTTYANHQISAVKLTQQNLAGQKLAAFPMLARETINYQN